MKIPGLWQKCKFVFQQSKTLSPHDKITLSITTSALLVGTLFIFGPINMYAGNANELWFPLSAILPMLLVLALGLFSVLVVFGCFLPVRFSRYIIALVFGLGIAFYIEGTFIPMDYGILDGKAVEWIKYADRIFYDNIIWSLCLILPLLLLLIKSNLFKKLVPMVCIALILMQGAGLVGVLPRISRNSGNSDYLTDEGKFTLGKEENIIVIILDCFDHRMFERSIGNSKALANSFNDFIHYENSMSTFSYTGPSIPSILTGIPYDNSIPFAEYVNSAYEKYPLLENLSNAGYDSRIFTFQNLTPISNNKVNTYIANKNKINNQMKRRLTYLMGQLTLMRQVPICLKENIWLAYDSFEKVKSKKIDYSNLGMEINTDLSFLNQLKQDGLTLIEGKAFRFYHFQGAHDQLNMDSNLNIVKDCKDGNLGRLDLAEGSLKIVAKFLQKIKNAGVYENSTIIITGDHSISTDPTMAYYLAPVMLIKYKNSNCNSIKKSSAPVTNKDIAATIMEIIQPNNNYGGVAISKIGENAKRIRKFYFYNGYASAKQDYLPNMIEFINENHTLFPQDFKKTGYILSADGIIKHKYKYYQLGKLIKSEDITNDWTSTKGDKVFYGERAVIGEGDWYSGDVFKTAGTYSTLGFTLSEAGQDLPVIMIIASVFEKDNPQRLFIEVNGSKLPDEFLFTNRKFERVTFNIPKELIKEDKILTLNLLTPDAKQIRNPFKVLYFFKEALEIKLLEIGRLNPAQKILFGSQEKNNSDLYKGKGWYDTGEKFTWSSEKAELFLPLDPTKDATLDFQLIYPIRKDYIKININGLDLGDWSEAMRGDSKWEYHKNMFLPKQYLTKEGMNKLVLTMAAPNPSGADTRILGLPVMSITIKYANPADQILFGSQKKGNSNFYKGKGWHNNEQKHTWCSEKAELLLPLDSTKDAILDFQLVNPHGQDYVKINMNGHDLGYWNEEMRGDTKWEYHKKMVLPQHFLEKSGMNKLVLTMAAPNPSGADTRILGLPVMSITIKYANPADQILFGSQKKGNSNYYKGKGWHNNEQKHAWCSEKAELVLPLDSTKDAILDFQLVNPHGQDYIKINMNGHDLGYWNEEMRGDTKWEYHKKMVLPQHFLEKSGMNKLVLTMAAPNPSGADTRILGLPVMSITIKYANPADQILFGSQKKGNSNYYKGKGWHNNEQKHAWSSEKAELLLPLDSTKDAILDFQLVYPHGQDYVKINMNGHDLGYWNEEMRGDTKWEYHKKMVLPQHFLEKSGMNKLVLTMAAPNPSGADTRILGLPVMSITIK